MKMNTIRFYSTNNTNINNPNKINASKTLYILPSIMSDDIFCTELFKIFLSLDPDKKYKFNFSMCIHTNNKNKQFIPTYPGMSNIYNDSNTEYFIYYKKWLEQVTSGFKFKGYINILNNTIDIKNCQGEQYAFNTYGYLGKKAGDVNSKGQEFMEYKRPVILIINKL